MGLRRLLVPCRCTILLLEEIPTEGSLQTFADGVILLKQLTPDYGAPCRRLWVVKVRGRQYVGGFHDFSLRQGGMEVFPRLTTSKACKPYEPTVLSSGIAALDALLGGGLMMGSSTLVVGAAGAVHKAISAVKKRSGSHETAIRELKFGPEGIAVGEALRQFQGILSGEPVFTGAPGELIQAQDDKNQGAAAG
jgi:hypothetical protein